MDRPLLARRWNGPPRRAHSTSRSGSESGNGASVSAGSSTTATRLGDLLRKEGLVTDAQLEEAVRVQASLQSYKPLGQILVDQGAITRRQLNHVLELYQKRPRLGDILLRSRAITQAQLDAALERHRQTGEPLGEALLQLRILTEEAMRQALCMRLNIPYVDLDKCVVDRSLGGIITKAYARRNSIVPIAKIGTTLTLAMDDPSDVRVIEEVQSYTGCAVSVASQATSAVYPWRNCGRPATPSSC
jgi:hypothetical protein